MLGDGTETTVYGAYMAGQDAMQLDAQVELLVGPFVLSKGPGPFRSVPAWTPSLLDPNWKLLEIYRSGFAEGWAPRWWFLSGADIERAIDEMATAEASREGFDGVGDSFETWGMPLPPDWQDWNAVVKGSWQRCRERYTALLSDARRDKDVVLLSYWVPDDQGTIHSPLDDTTGVLIASQETRPLR